MEKSTFLDKVVDAYYLGNLGNPPNLYGTVYFTGPITLFFARFNKLQGFFNPTNKACFQFPKKKLSEGLTLGMPACGKSV